MITLEQLVKICAALNAEGVKYVVIGGWAIYAHGYERVTRDIDLIVDSCETNIEKLKKALKKDLPEACAELGLHDLDENVVVRMVGRDVVLDIMKAVGDVDFSKAAKDVVHEKIDGIRVPIAGLETMLELKGGVRETDKRDYLFLSGKKAYLKNKK